MCNVPCSVCGDSVECLIRVKSELKTYSELNLFQKILFKLHLKKNLGFSKKSLNELISNTQLLEKIPGKDFSFMEYIREFY